MTNTIEITEKNLTHFNKRLQRALSEHFGNDVKLSEAATLFARACGKDSVYEIQKILSEGKPSSSKTLDSTEQGKQQEYIYSLAESNVIKVFKEAVKKLKNSNKNLSLELRKNKNSYSFRFIYFNPNNNEFISFDVPLEAQDISYSELWETISKESFFKNSTTMLHKQIKDFYSLISSFFQHKQLFADTIVRNFPKINDNCTVISHSEGFRNFTEINDSYYQASYKITLCDVVDYDGSQEIQAFREVKPALKHMALLCHTNQSDDITFTIEQRNFAKNQKSITNHYRFSNSTGQWLSKNRNLKITLKELKEIAHIAAFGDSETSKAKQALKQKQKQTYWWQK